MYNNQHARANIVPRPRLIDRLSEGLAVGCRLTLIVLSAGGLYDAIPEAATTSLGGPDVLAEVIRVHDENQQLLVRLSTRGTLIVAEKSGHEIQWCQPKLVVDAIGEIVEQVRGE